MCSLVFIVGEGGGGGSICKRKQKMCFLLCFYFFFVEDKDKMYKKTPKKQVINDLKKNEILEEKHNRFRQFPQAVFSSI